LGVNVGEDYVRIAKIGLDADFTDIFNGRTVLTQEFDLGIEDIMGGLDYKDPKASRLSSGGRFFRTVTNVARIQSLPHSASLMLRGAMQLTAYSLVAAEQFTIGGASTVRGYPRSEYAGDRGGTATAELYIPPYFLSKEAKVPFTENTKWFDALRFVGFFDYGYVENKNPQVGDIKDESIYSIGPAIRFNIPGRLEINFDYGFGLAGEGSDGSKTKGYIETKLYF
jgi:hemolysin activation/secretion protein